LANWRAIWRAASWSKRGAAGSGGSTVKASAGAGASAGCRGSAMTSGAVRRFGFAAGADALLDSDLGAGSASGAVGGGSGRSRKTSGGRATSIVGRGACPWRQANSSAACSANDSASPTSSGVERVPFDSRFVGRVGFTLLDRFLVAYGRISCTDGNRQAETS
jgi:hypothetical protein